MAPLLPILAPLAHLPMLAGRRWYVMGQICVAEAWRGRGVFDALYATHRAVYSPQPDCLVTEIATRRRTRMASVGEFSSRWSRWRVFLKHVPENVPRARSIA